MTCGENGGTTADGDPCQRPVSNNKLCHAHRADGELGPFHDIQHPKKRAFLAAFAETGSVTRATEAAGIDRTTPYSDPWKNDEGFQEAWDRARPMAADTLEAEAVRRAVEGVEEPVGFYKGVPSAMVRRYSDTLLIFLMKGANPEKYRDRADVRHSGRIEGGVMRVPESEDDPEDWEASVARALEKRARAAMNGSGG